MLKTFFLFLNRLFPHQPHPFDEGGCALDYAAFEYSSASQVFDLYKGYGKIESIVRGKRVLDVACGGGGKSVWLAQRGAKQVVGFDLEDGFIDQAHAFARKHGVASRCFFEVGDAAAMTYDDDSFDVAILNDVMEHVSDPESTLREVKRVVRPGGVVFINMEPYFHPNGSHMMDVVNIPWNHVFFSESFRIQMYRHLVSGLPDGEDRLRFRLSQDKDGNNYVGYLNHMTISRFEKLLMLLSGEGLGFAYMERRVFSRLPLRILGYLPFFREFFTRFLIVVLKVE